MLNQALRRTSGSNVQTIVSRPWLGCPLPLVQLHLPAEPGLADAREDPGDVAVQHQLSVVAPEESERAADHPAVAERPGDVAAGVPEGAQQLDADERRHRPPHLVEQHDEAAQVGRRLDDADLDVVAVVVLFSHRSPPQPVDRRPS